MSQSRQAVRQKAEEANREKDGTLTDREAGAGGAWKQRRSHMLTSIDISPD